MISDHCPTLATLNLTCTQPHTKKVTRFMPDYNTTDFEALRRDLHSLPLLDAIQGTDSMDAAWQTWSTLFQDTLSKHLQWRKIHTGKNKKPWVSSSVRAELRARDQLFKTYLRHRCQENWDRYRKCRNTVTTILRDAKRSYYDKLSTKLTSQDLHDDSKKWWSKAKRACHISTPASHFPVMQSDGESFTTDEGKANILASYLSKQCTLPPSSTQPPPLTPLTKHSFTFPVLREEEVMNCLKRLSPRKSPGLDGITNRVLKETAPFLAPSLTFLFNLSLRTQHIPAAWKIGLVSPIYKHKGKPWCPSNYRPVSLLSCVAKAFESILCRKLLIYLLKNNLVSEHQFGFLP